MAVRQAVETEAAGRQPKKAKVARAGSASARNGQARTADVADQIFEALVRLAWGARQHDQTLQRGHGVTAAQLSALRVLERHGDMTHTELSERLFLRGSTVSGMVDRLERRGLITRRRSKDDRRLVRVALAAGGKRLLAGIPRGLSKFGALRRLVRDLPEGDARVFMRALHKMVELLGAGGARRRARQERTEASP